LSGPRFSHSARADLLRIGVYTLQTWGAAQTERYLSAMQACANLLAENPLLGRPCDWIRPGLYRFEKEQHVFFYRRQDDGIFIVRLLHRSMMPDQNQFEDSPSEI